MDYWIVNFPLPPSVNTFLMPARGRLIKTGVHRNYRELCLWWGVQNKAQLNPIKKQLMDMKDKLESQKMPFCLSVDCYFVFHHERIFTGSSKCKSIDTNNFIKPVLDGLVKITDIDDKHYFGGRYEKVTTTEKSKECAILKISPMYPRALQDIQKIMGRDFLSVELGKAKSSR